MRKDVVDWAGQSNTRNHEHLQKKDAGKRTLHGSGER